MNNKDMPDKEFNEAIFIANKFLNEPHEDPDSDKNILARQFIRLYERADIAPAPKAVEERTTEEKIRKMMQDPKYWRDRDPETIKKVSAAFNELYDSPKSTPPNAALEDIKRFDNNFSEWQRLNKIGDYDKAEQIANAVLTHHENTIFLLIESALRNTAKECE